MKSAPNTLAGTTWPELRIADWRHFDQLVEAFGSPDPSKPLYIFRGQADARWPLTPSLRRLLPADVGAETALGIERDALMEFQAQAHLHAPAHVLPPAGHWMGWWPLMQHHRAPTRLLDWTESPFVAAYFAAEREWGEDGAVWVARTDAVDDSWPGRGVKTGFTTSVVDFTHPDAPHTLRVWFPPRRTDRMVAQQGCFAVCRNVLGDHGRLIHSLCGPEGALDGDDNRHCRLVLPKELKPAFLRRLRTMNVTANALFPGADGLGHSVAELVRLRGVAPTEEGERAV